MTVTSDLENELFRSGVQSVVGIDEVGRGAGAGPVVVAAVKIRATDLRHLPRGIDDSKRLTASQRSKLLIKLSESDVRFAVGFSSAQEIDRFGLTEALRCAAELAIAELDSYSGVILLDGKHDYLNAGRERSRNSPSHAERYPPGIVSGSGTGVMAPRIVKTVVGGDALCVSVAAASIVAKVLRDRYMDVAALALPVFRWESNKGYLTQEHRSAIELCGLSDFHRKSWNLLH